MSKAVREFLFTYHFGGVSWGTSVFADSTEEAKEKIKAVGMARYDGELMMRIPAATPGGGLIASLICWLRNRRVQS